MPDATDRAGFGLFRDYRSNSSSEVVRALGKAGIPGVHLVVVEVPVEYEAVSTLVPKLWEQHRPVVSDVGGAMSENASLASVFTA